MAKKVPADHRERSLNLYTKEGWVAANVERKRFAVSESLGGGKHVVRFYGTVDLFGFADMLAFGKGGRTAFVQYTSKDNASDHRKTIRGNEHAVELASRGFEIHLLLWDQPKGKGTRYVHKIEFMHEELVNWEVGRPIDGAA